MGEDRGTPEPISESGLQYFCFLADMGITKHGGSLDATLELVELCHIGKDSYVLDVGCGVGATPSFLAKELGCRVVGVDITPKMIQRAQARIEGDGVADMVELRVADARVLPFEDNTFDAVICESVIVFLEDKQRAVDEFARVVKPGGYVGLTEGTLLKPTDDAEFMAYMGRVAGIQGDMLPMETWAQYLHDAHLRDVVARAHPLDVRQEAKGRIERYGCARFLGVLARMARMWFGDPEAKAFLKDAFPGTAGTTRIYKTAYEYMGYGVYVGRK
jgi:ubiquinone/menaquinone biosynthesis C-methylase UbiE